MQEGVQVAQRLHLQVFDQPGDSFDGFQECGDDDHRPRALGNPFGQINARQPSRGEERGRQFLDEEDGRVARRQENEERDPAAPCVPGETAGVAES